MLIQLVHSHIEKLEKVQPMYKNELTVVISLHLLK